MESVRAAAFDAELGLRQLATPGHFLMSQQYKPDCKVIATDTLPAHTEDALPCGLRRAVTHLLQLGSDGGSLIASWHGQVLCSLQPEQLEAVLRARRVWGGLGSQVQVANLQTEAWAVLRTGVACCLQQEL